MRYLKTRSVIEFLSSMTHDNVREKIQETFPYLENKKYVNILYYNVIITVYLKRVLNFHDHRSYRGNFSGLCGIRTGVKNYI